MADPRFHATTRALRHRIQIGDARPVVTPIFQSSAFAADSPYFYSRKDNPNVRELEEVVRTFEGAKHAVAVASGMAAISLALSLLEPGSRLAVHRLIYGCTFRLFDRLRSRGIRVDAVDLAQTGALASGADMVFFETPTNPFLRTLEIERIAREAKAAEPRCLVVVDNTWATPFFQRPLEHGADLSIHSATKFLSGHSDVMGGVVLTDRADLHDRLREERFYVGSNLDPHSAWLLRRSTQTLPLRMRAHQETTKLLAELLRGRSEVETVYLPVVDGKQLTGYGGILFFQLRAGLEDAYPRFASALRLFSTGTGMAAVTSMVAQPYSGSHASLTADEKRRIGLDPGLVRLCFGLEEPDDLERDLVGALSILTGSARREAG